MKENGIKKVSVIGAGLMGFGVGVEFARFGYEVSLYNTREESSRNAMALAKEALDLMVENGMISTGDAGEAFSRLHPTTNFEEAVEGANFIHESVPDRLSTKMAVFIKLDELCPPSTILATNSSSLLVSDIAAATGHPERVIATHYYQPPHFLPIVEVMPGAMTAPDVVEKTVELMRSLRKKVVFLAKETPGYIGNRLQRAMGEEIRSLVDEGVATPEMIDNVIAYGFGRRLPYTAHFRQMDLRGLDFSVNSAEERGVPVWKPVAEHVARGELGMKTGRGFYDWSGGKAKQLHRRLDTELVRLMQHDLEAGEI